MPLSPDTDSHIEERKRVYLQCLNAFKATSPLLNTYFYQWKARGDYNLVSKWFSGNQMPPYMAKSSKTDLKEYSHKKAKKFTNNVASSQEKKFRAISIRKLTYFIRSIKLCKKFGGVLFYRYITTFLRKCHSVQKSFSKLL